MDTARLARALMERFEATPYPPGVDPARLPEVFHHPVFAEADDEARREMMLASSTSTYEDELAYPWDNYFEVDLLPLLRGAAALDLGCFNGGRGVAWFERYGFSHLAGIDVAQEYVDAAQLFAESRDVTAEFRLGRGESLPFPDGRFDAVLSFDVFEHVQDVGATLAECRRVLRPGGKLCVVFPGYWHPREHHLGLATRLPGIHYVFSGETLVRAYYEILRDRGHGAAWYRRPSPELESWERGASINGTTVSQFRALIRRGGWKVVHESKLPIGSVGRMFAQSSAARSVGKLLKPIASLPLAREILLHRITYVLERG